MSGRPSKSRQQPLGPDETFSALVTRLIISNRMERASRDRIHPTPPSAGHEMGGDRRREARGGARAEP
jgi:hypothetical protein